MMPIYDYRCPACSEVHEAKKSVAERETDPCPSCGATAVQKISPVGFALKGNGWARDGYGRAITGEDYRSGKVSKKALADIPVAGPDGKLYQHGKHIAG
jgi:putative FmdB family regulatory protein